MSIHYKHKSLYLLLSFLLLLNCKDKTSVIDNNSETIEEIKITAKDIEELKYTDYALSNLSEKKSEDWLSLQELFNQIEILKKGDLAFFNDENELLTSFITDLKDQMPEEFNIPSIQARLSALETAIFKLEGINNLKNLDKETILNYIKEVLVAHSNLILQINKKFEKESQKIEKS